MVRVSKHSKKNTTTYRLLSRRFQDPSSSNLDEEHQSENNGPDPYTEEVSDNSTGVPPETSKSKRSRLRELQQYGIDFDDDYDYLQHLRPRGDGDFVPADWFPVDDRSHGLRKPDNVDSEHPGPSQRGESAKLSRCILVKAGPDDEPDKDLVDMMQKLEDGQFDLTDSEADQLEDDFVVQAMTGEKHDGSGQGGGTDDEEGWETCSDNEDREQCESVRLPMQGKYRVRPGAAALEDHLSKIMAEYADDQIGDPVDYNDLVAVDEEQTSPVIDQHVFSQLLADFRSKVKIGSDDRGELDDKEVGDFIRQYVSRLSASSSEHSSSETDSDEQEKWDCESVLSTYSNTDNRPKLISLPTKARRIKLSEKTGIPVGVFQPQLTAKALSRFNRGLHDASGDEQDMDDKFSTASSCSVRPKGETPEERRLRKQAVKDDRKFRRAEKKANKLAFLEEKVRQVKVIENARVLQGVTLDA